MIVLLNYSTSLLANDIQYLSTGDVIELTDSVLIAYDDLRIVNSKLIELNYEKEENITLRQIIRNDSIIIKDYSNLNKKLNNDYKKIIRQRNICIGVSVIAIIASIIIVTK